MHSTTIKDKLQEFCKQYAQERQHRIEQRIANIRESLSSETKSTAGDKHETGRAMLQLEREKSGAQLSEVLKLQEIIAKVNTKKASSIVHLGSLVSTTLGNYYICISAGEYRIENTNYYTIAANTPIGQLLLGKTTGASFHFREQQVNIIDIF